MTASKVSLPNQEIGKRITLQPKPTDLSATIPWSSLREKNKMNSCTNMIGMPSVRFCTFKRLVTIFFFFKKKKTTHIRQTWGSWGHCQHWRLNNHQPPLCWWQWWPSRRGRRTGKFILAEHLDKASTAYGMEISAKKTKLMTNNTSGINTEIKMNGQKLEKSQDSSTWAQL